MMRSIPGPVLQAPARDTIERGSDILASAAAWLSAAWAVTGPDNRHSRRVALLKRVLPATGLALLLLIAMWPRLAPLWDRMRLAFPAIDLREARELRMVSPHYAGTDHLGRPFVVTAAVGRQVPDRQDLMSLEAPRANLKMHGDGNVVVTAATGIYQAQAQLLDLFGEVTLVQPNGTSFVTDTARVDAADNSAEGSDPVEGHGPSGDIKAEGFRVLDKGATIIFTGKCDLLLRGAKPGTEKTTPAALPAPIAATAARVEAEAKPVLAAAAPVARRQAAATHRTKAHERKAPARAKPAAKKKG